MPTRHKYLTLPLLTAALVGGMLTATPAQAATNQATPQGTVKAFFTQLRAHNAGAIARLYSPRESTQYTIAKAAKYQRHANGKISAWRILDASLYGSSATVRTSYRQDGKLQELDLKLVQGGPSGRAWYLSGSSPFSGYSSGTYGGLFATGKTYMLGKNVKVVQKGGRAIVKGKGKLIAYNGAPLLPGSYTFITKDAHGYFTDKVGKVTRGVNRTLKSSISTPQLTNAGRAAASKAVLDMLHTCASTVYTDKAGTIAEAEAFLTHTYGETCPSWSSTNALYDADGGRGANQMFPDSQHENLEPWFYEEYASHNKFRILSDPQVQLTGDAAAVHYKLVGGSYQLWTWLRHYNEDDIFDAADKDTYEYSWSQAASFDGSGQLTDDTSSDTDDLTVSPTFLYATDLAR